MKQPSSPPTSTDVSFFPVRLFSTAITHLFRLQVNHFLTSSITKGSLTFTFPNEPSTRFGQPPEDAARSHHPIATIHLTRPTAFYARVATQADIGFAEAYMAADFTVDSLEALLTVFRLLILNRDARTLSTPALLSRVGAYANNVLHRLNRNSLQGSRRNIEAHYDLSNDLFATFLGNTWVYSCAIFAPGRTLDDAQIAKLDSILTKAHLNDSVHLLDIGCGWGDLAIRAAKRHRCHVTGITLSNEQLMLARKRAVDAGVDDRVRFELVDYRHFAHSHSGCFDRVVSVEMAEAVGHEFLGVYFGAIDTLLKEDGLAVIQVITTPEGRYDAYRSGTDFIQKHIFPGGLCPSLEAMVSAIASSSSFMVESVENIGVHYATTLAEWRRRFLKSVQAGDVQRAGFGDEVFVRKWLYYLCYCESGFATRTLRVLQMVLTRIGNVRTLGEPPVLAQCQST